MRNRTLIIVIAALLISNRVMLGVYFFGKDGKKNSDGKNDRSPVGYMTRELSLDSSQKDQFRAFWEAVNQKNKVLYDSIRQNREALYRRLADTATSDAVVSNFASTMAAYEKQITINNFAHFRKVRAICDSTQQQKLDTLIAKMAKRGRRH